MQKKLRESAVLRGVATLMSGTLLAQLIPLLISPILTRWYEPQDFGAIAVFVALTTVIATVATGRYELAMPLPSDETEAAMLVWICGILSTIISAIVSLVVLIFYDEILSNSTFVNAEPWLWLLGPSVLFVGVYQGLNYWHLRQNLYWAISSNRVAQSAVNAGVSLGLAKVLTGGSGLIIGEFASRVLVTLRHSKSFFKRTVRTKFNVVDLFRVAAKHRKCPCYLVPAGLLSISSKQLPILAFAYLLNAEFVGFLLLTQRVIQTPLGIISGAVSEVLLQRTAEEFRNTGHCRKIFRQVLLFLAVGGFIPLAIFYFVAPTLLEWLFGSNWSGLGEFVRVLLPFYYIYFVAGTLNVVIISSGKQKVNLLMQGLYALLTSVSIYFGFVLGTENAMLVAYATGSSVYFLAALGISFYVSNGNQFR